MTQKERRAIREKIADYLTEQCDLEALMQHYYNDQMCYLEDLSDEDLLFALVDVH
jgi:ketosteroid isomerase-like protein